MNAEKKGFVPEQTFDTMEGGHGRRGIFSMILSEKQVRVLATIDRFGLLTSTQLVEMLKGEVSHVTIYNSKKKLADLGFLHEEKIGYRLILSIRPSGVDYLGSTLTAFTKINYGTMRHQLLMNDAILALKALAEQRGQSFAFQTERELRSDYLDLYFSPTDRRNPTKLKRVPERIPDFVVEEHGERMAYEVELTRKSAKRYLEKMTRYRDEVLNGTYQSVRYLCESDKLLDVVRTYAKQAGMEASMLQLDLLRRLFALGENQRGSQ
ncbi:replication-relaxation family protein [Thalassobacillus pellis]|uniref:replication-relaxation family protein n=1 Tax=Thalassobacillus pellis TaxID=748008 RepID=UPI001961E123|nr:replication-relaxation family protein [Thalassobacillus pellis]MBM7554421.1 hypothetical protein [Thalassobacillus pellis]